MPRRRLLRAVENPARLVLSAFVSLIAIGAALLRLPFAVEGPHPGLSHALFSATSATTVTGLATVDITRFSAFGELVLLVLIQIGGFGIMALGAILAVVPLRGRTGREGGSSGVAVLRRFPCAPAPCGETPRPGGR